MRRTFKLLLNLLFSFFVVAQIKTAVFNEEIDPDYSQQLLSSLVSVERHTIEPIIFATLDEALNAIKRNKVIGVIHFKSNYSYAIDERLENFMDFDNQTMEESSLHLYLDNSIITYANPFITSLKISLEKFLSKLFKEKNLSSIETPIQVEKLKLTENLLPQDHYLPGLMLHMLYFSSMIISSLALILERKDGLFERSLIAGVRHELVFISHLITNVLLSFIQVLLMIFIIFVIFTNKNEGSIVLIFCLFITQSINSISTGFLISTLLNEEFHCLLIVASIAVPQFFSSGIIWPIESLDKPLRALFNFCPLTLPTEAVKDILLRGYDLRNRSVESGFFLSFIPCIIFIGLSLMLFKRR
jgi:ABC-type polysaccharide/polyol phosphate export permease